MLTSSLGRALKGVATASVLTVALSGCTGGTLSDFLDSLFGGEVEIPTAPSSTIPGPTETTPTVPGDASVPETSTPGIETTIPGTEDTVPVETTVVVDETSVPLDTVGPTHGGRHGNKTDVPPAAPAGADS
jgi:hypothetical protein